MKKSEIFDVIMGFVTDICEVRYDIVINDRRYQAVVDARCLAVQYCRHLGLSNDDIALIVLRKQNPDLEYPSRESLKKKSRSIDAMYRAYLDRFDQSLAFREMSREIDRKIHEMFSVK